MVVAQFKDKNDVQPGIKDIPKALGVDGFMYKSIAKALEKSHYIDNSIYKYLIYDNSTRKKFMKVLDNLEERIEKNGFCKAQ